MESDKKATLWPEKIWVHLIFVPESGEPADAQEYAALPRKAPGPGFESPEWSKC